MSTFVVGDIHGAAKALEQCLERSGFDREKDRLITLGDICDGWSYVYECVNILLSIPNRIDIRGNHDQWFVEWLMDGRHPDHWCQGGYATAASYMRALGKGDSVQGAKHTGYFPQLHPDEIPDLHKEFFHGQQDYVLLGEASDRLFVHGGIDRHRTLVEQERDNPFDFYWDRNLWAFALAVKANGQKLKFAEPFSEIYIGHTATTMLAYDDVIHNGFITRRGKNKVITPVQADIVWNLDTGAGWDGKLTIMDIDTKEYWQSDLVKDLYPDEKGR